MNTEQLLTVVRSLTQLEDKQQFQQKLTELVSALNNLAGSPQDTNYQTDVSDKLKAFEKTLTRTEADFSPAYIRRLEELGALPFFSTAMVQRIRQALADNSMTPAVVRQEAQDLLTQRAQFIDQLRSLESSLNSLGFEEDDLEPGEAEIGFQIPRSLFENELGGFARELQEVRFIIRPFSELTGNAGEPVEVRTISTTDPQIFLGVALPTIMAIGAAVSWCLDQWKKVEEIRKLRAETANLKIPAAQKLADQYDQLIKDSVKEQVTAEAARLIADGTVEGERKNEVQTFLEKALEALLARIERGMTVEIRLIPPPKEEGNEEAEATAVAFQDLAQIQKQLAFPAPSGEPVLKLPRLAEGDDKAKADPSKPKGG